MKRKMILDKTQSLKNKVMAACTIGALVTTLGGISSKKQNILTPSYAQAKTYTEGNVSIEYIYDEDHKGKAAIDYGKNKLVAISDYENDSYVILSLEQLDNILEKSNDEIITINNMEFNRHTLTSLIENYSRDEEADKKNSAIIISITVGAVALFISYPILEKYAEKLKIRKKNI